MSKDRDLFRSLCLGQRVPEKGMEWGALPHRLLGEESVETTRPVRGRGLELVSWPEAVTVTEVDLHFNVCRVPLPVEDPIADGNDAARGRLLGRREKLRDGRVVVVEGKAACCR